MEKFAVDLDKVLDEFEFNEDRAEQMVAVTGKGCCSSAETGEVSRRHSASQFCQQGYRNQHATESAPLNSYNNECNSTPSIGPARIDVSSGGSSSFITNGISNSQNIYWPQDIVIQNSINSSSSHNKLNVSGVFSSLNEYLNTGNTNIGVVLKNEDSELIDNEVTENLKVSLNKSSSSREPLSQDEVIPSRNFDNCLCSCKKYGIHTCHHLDILDQPYSQEVSTHEMKIESYQKITTDPEDILNKSEDLNSSPAVDRTCSFDVPCNLSENILNFSILNEGELDTKVVDFNFKTSDLCSVDTEDSRSSFRNSSADTIGTLSVADNHPEDRTCSGTSNCEASFDCTSKSEANVKPLKGTEQSFSGCDINKLSGIGVIQNEVHDQKASLHCPETNNASSLRIPPQNDVQVDTLIHEGVCKEKESPQNLAELNEKLSESTTEMNSVCQPIGFSTVCNFSKEELEKYLEELSDNGHIDHNNDAADELEFHGVSEFINASLSTSEENSNLECEEKMHANCERNDVFHSGCNKSVLGYREDSNPISSEAKKTLSLKSGEFDELENDNRLEGEVSCKSDSGDTNVNIQNISNLDVIRQSDEACSPGEPSELGDQSNVVQESNDENLNATISISILNTSKSTTNVTNVVSIECQQTKNCMVNDEVQDTNSNIGATHSTDENDNQTIMCESKGNGSASVYCSEEKCTRLSDIGGSPVCGNLEGNESVLHSNYTQPTERHAANNCSDKELSENNDHSNVVVGGCLVQVPRNGSRINVLGEEERPCRPKFLLLPSKIVVENQSETLEKVGTLPQNVPLGLPGETPGTHLEPSQEIQNNNSANPVAETAGNSMLTSPDASDSSSLEVAISPVPSLQTTSPSNNESSPYVLSPEERSLGKLPPFWVPDSDAPNCMLCDLKFTVLKRRHHCRACGKVLCSKCCSLKSRLEYMENAEARVCHPCFDILAKVLLTEQGESASESPNSLPLDSNNAPLGRQPNPNNPMEYCSTIPPLEQAASTSPQPVPSVMVPVGVLKREGCGRPKGDVTKQVMFSDGIRPGGDLTELDGSSEPRLPYRRQERILKRVGTPPGVPPNTSNHSALRSLLSLEPKTKSYIPSKGLPPLATMVKGELKLEEVVHLDKLFTSLKTEVEPAPMFALNRNLFVQIKILNLDCCVNRLCWCFSTIGMSSVGQDEIVIILEYLPEDTTIPKDIFHHLNTIYQDASRGNMVSEMGHTVFQGSTFLGSSEHGGFIYIRPSFQCLHKLILPAPPYLVAILFHRWEIPWAKVFPIRLMLRLGAEFRYYPCMLVSVRQRKPVFCEIGHTIINLLADFRNLSYTLPSVRGLVIHMEDRHTSILLPKNRYDQVARALNNSNDHVLALAANFSMSADSHLVCIQSHEDESYHTQAINIHNKPRKVTGASFVVFNGALKISSNLTAKSSIVEDGLMVQITPDTIQELRSALRKMQDFSVRCGPAGAVLPDEMVNIKWVQDDRNFNIGVVSFIDGLALDGVPSIRVHNGTDYMGPMRFIRWTEVFILQSGENSERSGDPLDISRLSESLARATCLALVNYLDLLAQAGLTKIAVRANIHPENVGYEAGSRGEKLPPIYMKSLDNELVPVLHKAASMAPESPPVLLELIFHVLLQ
ncbi:zinc finger FYVE domain-containing protein 16 [Anabrus simplex]|uniref:zinc finger FYVE domain-containing protein 16 n=1 Tax=Anabrus simplex TaxID=316456 RepID=UPI0035A2BAE7